jgi:ribosomal protein S18 acetylase RimI-like enzyme
MNKNVSVSAMSRDTDNHEKITKFISTVEESFRSRISQRTNIDTFIHKILDKAIILQAVVDDEIVGLSSFYANDLENMKSYWTFLAINPLYKNMGIASRFIKKC